MCCRIHAFRVCMNFIYMNFSDRRFLRQNLEFTNFLPFTLGMHRGDGERHPSHCTHHGSDGDRTRPRTNVDAGASGAAEAVSAHAHLPSTSVRPSPRSRRAISARPRRPLPAAARWALSLTAAIAGLSLIAGSAPLLHLLPFRARAQGIGNVMRVFFFTCVN